MTLRESAVHVTTMLSGPWRPPVPASVAGWNVSRRAAPPAAGITQISVPAFPASVYAIHLPSGDTRGNMSCPGALVNRTAVPPLFGTDHTLPFATNTIAAPKGCGNRGRAARVAITGATARRIAGNKRLAIIKGPLCAGISMVCPGLVVSVPVVAINYDRSARRWQKRHIHRGMVVGTSPSGRADRIPNCWY